MAQTSPKMLTPVAMTPSTSNEIITPASTSMVTLDDLRAAYVEEKRKELSELKRAHNDDLREMFFMMETYDKEDRYGSPFKLPRHTLAVPEDDKRPEVLGFLNQYQLLETGGRSIANLDLVQPTALRTRLTKELGTGPIEIAPPPATPTSSQQAALEARKEKEKLKELEKEQKAANQRAAAVNAAAAAAAAKAGSDTNAIPIMATQLAATPTSTSTLTSSSNSFQSKPPSTPAQQKARAPLAIQIDPMASSSPSQRLPSTSLSPTKTLASQTASQTSSDAVVPNTQSTSLTVPAAASQSQSSTHPSPKAPSGTDANKSKKVVSPTLVSGPPPANGPPASEITGVKLPPSPAALPSLQDTYDIPPLHPTLQKLSPNPLSVTYASSLRPLPPDPNRRFTGAGVGGGAIHHRGNRKIPQPANGTKAPTHAGPAGSGSADLWRWHVRARASPGAGMVGKADKCLMTSDWKVAFTEQRFVRAMARIEKLKSAGEWSFRQPKKQKGPVVRKSHWDHLLEEMKWLQTDFREERRWKVAVAYQLAHEVLTWHRARTPTARAVLCVKTRRPEGTRAFKASAAVEGSANGGTRDVQMEEPDAKGVTTSDDAQSGGKQGSVAVPGDDADRKDGPSSRKDEAIPVGDIGSGENEVGRNLADGDAEADADADMDADADADADGEADAEGDIDADGEADAEGEDMDADGDADDGEVEAATGLLLASDQDHLPPIEVVNEPREAPPAMPELSADDPGSADVSMKPPAGAEGVEEEKPTVKFQAPGKDATLAAELSTSLISTVRAPIFSMDITATTVSPSALIESLNPEAAAEMLGIDVSDLPMAADSLDPDELTFSKMFPELPLYAGPSLPDPMAKSDRRWDEGSLNQPPRLTQVTRLLDSKPLLVSTLEPSKNRAQGRWLDDSDWIVAAEQSDPLRGIQDGPVAEAGPQLPGSLLFTRRSSKSSREPAQGAAGIPTAPASPDARAAQFMWTPEEDSHLLTLAKQYNNNWSLVSDLFNSTRLTISIDKREPWDCYDRAKRIQQAADEGKPPPGPPQLAQNAAATAAPTSPEKQQQQAPPTEGSPPSLTATSLAAKRDKLNKKLGTKYDGSRKKLRRSNLMEVMRKSAKKRDASQKAAAQSGSSTRKVNLASHETHAQIKAGPVPSPQTLSAIKTERDQAALRQYYEQQRAAQFAYQQQQQQ
ncbi:hypothetical protein IE53DRAFT_370153, partial [Violaceomyces palustris]